ncbi:MAG: hypothetical protein ACNA8W_05535 [Bradymonadaceae bacterium]
MLLRWRLWTVVLAFGLLTAAPALAQEETSPPDAPAVEEEASPAEDPVDEPVDAEPEPIPEPIPEPEPEPEPIPEPGEEDELDEEFDDYPAGTIAVSPGLAPVAPSVIVGTNDEDHTGPWRLILGGYIRTQYSMIEEDPQVEFIGRNDGFMMADARSTVVGELDNGLGFVFQFDASAPIIATAAGSPVRELTLRMTDMYIFYAPLYFLQFSVGQFKAPFEAENLLSKADLLFVERSVGSRGVRGFEGFPVPGLSIGRELGARVQGSYFLGAEPGEFEGPGVSYAAAITNGNGPNRSMNNNSRHAYYGRAALHWGEYVAVGGAYMHNDDTLGEPPNRIDRLIRGWTADLQAAAFGVSFLASMTNQTLSAPDLPQEPDAEATAYQAQIGYQLPFFGLQPVYRFAYYDPGVIEDDDLIYHTVGLNYNAANYPIRLMFNYTITVEEDARELDNNRFDALLQLEW